MPAIKSRKQVDGSTRYTVVVRIRRQGKVLHREAAEDLMREYGVLRRALLVYAEAAARLLRGRSDVGQADCACPTETRRLMRATAIR
jgi:hypothetical protein